MSEQAFRSLAEYFDTDFDVENTTCFDNAVWVTAQLAMHLDY